jgi:hypothetical protein
MLLASAQAAVIDKYRQYETLAAQDGSHFQPGSDVIASPAL